MISSETYVELLHASEPTWSVYPTEATDLDCQTCGACCSYSSDWPRFTSETDEALDALPAHFVTAHQRGMRCESSRCSALSGTVGETTTCLVYEARPDVCRACSPVIMPVQLRG